MSPWNASAVCSSTVGDVRLPSEAAELDLAGRAVPHDVRPARDSVVVRVVGVGRGRRCRPPGSPRAGRLPIDLRREPRARSGGRRRVVRTPDRRSCRSAPGSVYGVPSPYVAGFSRVGDRRARPRRGRRGSPVLQLVAVDRVRAAGRRSPSVAGNRQAEQQAERRRRRRRGRECRGPSSTWHDDTPGR